jgi:hypothetical protein
MVGRGWTRKKADERGLVVKASVLVKHWGLLSFIREHQPLEFRFRSEVQQQADFDGCRSQEVQ